LAAEAASSLARDRVELHPILKVEMAEYTPSDAGNCSSNAFPNSQQLLIFPSYF
jgi:hypothetical protein